jgi:hypothetical protein
MPQEPQTATTDATAGTHARPREPELKMPSERRRTVHDISFGIQQTIICWITDVITDPLFSMLAQNNRHLKKIFHDESEHDTTIWQQVKSEVSGDLLALVTFVPLRKLFRKPFDAAADWVEKRLDRRFDALGRKTLREWAEHHGLREDDPAYQKRLREFKDARADNVVDSSLLGVLSLVFNTVSQKAFFKSDKPWGLVAVGKAIGMLITVGATLGFKTFMPKSSHKVDHALERHVLGPVSNWVAHKAGDPKLAETADFYRPPERETDARAAGAEPRTRHHPEREPADSRHRHRVDTARQRDDYASQGIAAG